MNAVPIFLDGFSTLPLAPEARAAMLALWDEPGNAGSPHAAGERAARAIDAARSSIAALIGASPSEIIFTSGATEANNLAIIGATLAAAKRAPGRRRIIVSAIEHKAVLTPAEHLAGLGFELVRAPVGRDGLVELDELERLIDETTLLVSIMAVNNETGVIQPVEAAARFARAAGALIHSDAAQAIGKIAVDVVDLDLDYLSMSAHKCYGPMGIGALYVAASAPNPEPLHFGGGQQGGIRPGTEPVPLIAGFGTAAELAESRLERDRRHGAALITTLTAALSERQVRFSRIGTSESSVPGALAIQLDGVDAEMLCTRLARTVALSTGSACTAGQLKTSHVLEAMGFSSDEAQGILRIFCHRYLSSDDVVRAAEQIAAAACRSPLAAGRLRQ